MRHDWVNIRAKYEAGASSRSLAVKYKISHTAINKHVRSEGWIQDVSKSLQQKTDAKVAGVVSGGNSKKVAEALDLEAQKRADIITGHRKEWEIVSGLRGLALQYAKDDAPQSFDRMKLAKITSEVTAIKQIGERKAWGIVDVSSGTNISISNANVNASFNIENMSDEELDAIIARGILAGGDRAAITS